MFIKMNFIYKIGYYIFNKFKRLYERLNRRINKLINNLLFLVKLTLFILFKTTYLLIVITCETRLIIIKTRLKSFKELKFVIKFIKYSIKNVLHTIKFINNKTIKRITRKSYIKIIIDYSLILILNNRYYRDYYRSLYSYKSYNNLVCTNSIYSVFKQTNKYIYIKLNNYSYLLIGYNYLINLVKP